MNTPRRSITYSPISMAGGDPTGPLPSVATQEPTTQSAFIQPAAVQSDGSPAGREGCTVSAVTVSLPENRGFSATILPAPPRRAPCKRMRVEEPAQEAVVLASEPAVVLDLNTLQAQLTTLHTDMVSRLTNLQDSLNSVQAKTTGLEASMVHMDQKLDLHLECIQEYQHQLCQTLHQDLERVFQHFAELKRIGGTPPVSLVRTMAALANEALQLYQ